MFQWKLWDDRIRQRVETDASIAARGSNDVDGIIITASIASGGSGYDVDDVVEISGGLGARYTIREVIDNDGESNDGEVTRGQLTIRGTGYSDTEDSAPADTTSGSGSGLTLNLVVTRKYKPENPTGYTIGDSGANIPNVNKGHFDSLPISRTNVTSSFGGQGGQARLPIVEFDNDNKPKNIALINFFGSLHNIGGTVDTVPRETSSDLIDYPPNRIAVINTLSTWSDNNLHIRIRHRDISYGDHEEHDSSHGAHIYNIGALMFFDDWEECNRPDTINVETVTPQLMGDAETATPIPGVLAGRRKRVSMTWNGVAFDDPELKPLMNLLDELDDRNKPVLFRPSTDRPMYFFGRLERWNYASRGSTDTINATFITDGMGQP